MTTNISNFSNNEGAGGFEDGGYDLQARHPVDVNWTRQSKFSVPSEPKLLWKVAVDNAFIDGTSISPAFVVDKDQNVLFTDRDNNLGEAHLGRLLKVSKKSEIKELYRIDKG